MDNLMTNLTTMTWELAAAYVAAGAVGGLLRHLLSKGGLILPSKKKIGGEVLLRLGFLSSIVVGASAGMLVDHHWVTAFFAGYGGPHMLEKMYTKFLLNGKT